MRYINRHFTYLLTYLHTQTSAPQASNFKIQKTPRRYDRSLQKTHDIYDRDASLKLAYHSDSITRGNKYKLSNHVFHYDLRKYYFSARIVNIWNSLPDHVVDVNTINLFKTRLDIFWANQDVKYDFTADLTGTGDRSVYEVCDT